MFKEEKGPLSTWHRGEETFNDFVKKSHDNGCHLILLGYNPDGTTNYKEAYGLSNSFQLFAIMKLLSDKHMFARVMPNEMMIDILEAFEE